MRNKKGFAMEEYEDDSELVLLTVRRKNRVYAPKLASIVVRVPSSASEADVRAFVERNCDEEPWCYLAPNEGLFPQFDKLELASMYGWSEDEVPRLVFKRGSLVHGQ